MSEKIVKLESSNEVVGQDKRAHMVLYSMSQDSFHIEELDHHCAKNIRKIGLGANAALDSFVPVGYAEDYQAARAISNGLRRLMWRIEHPEKIAVNEIYKRHNKRISINSLFMDYDDFDLNVSLFESKALLGEASVCGFTVAGVADGVDYILSDFDDSDEILLFSSVTSALYYLKESMKDTPESDRGLSVKPVSVFLFNS